ncbi:filamin-A isoform X3 [Palaemon carinicauda]|uniref:filamin-A isoform X3 n=1 Tax=Palaemon carinicauda TaxID=392227 RepID=UPI0035B5E075
MSVDEEDFKMRRAGLVARSAEGHAAKGMRIKDQEDMWVEIQHHTFKNWVNVQLRDTGLKVEDLSEDLRDGLALVTLVEVLQKRRLRKVKRVLNQHQALENVTTALNAISDDGIKLVNIGNVDIVNGNLKLILGLIWSLIMHYQIGQSKFPPKKLMLAWLKAVLPDCRVHNFTSDWNSGVYLSALLEYCKPGLYSNWKNLNPRNAVDNCKNAMEIAKAEFNIPMLLEPEILSSPYLDELSGMTYLSYFMKEGGPGYKATLEWVRRQLPDSNVKNFTTDWNDGMNLTTLVKQLGGPVPGYKKLTPAPQNWESNLVLGIDGGKKLGVEPILTAADMARPDVESLGNMGYIAYFQWVRPRECPSDAIAINCNLDNVRVNNPVPFEIEFLSKEVVLSEIRVEVRGPSGPCRVDLDLGPRGGNGVFIPDQVGIYELNVYNEEELVEGCPVKVRALPDVSKIMFSGIDPCAIGSIVEVVVNSNGAGSADIEVTAYSPTNRPLPCPVKVEDGVYAAVFQPDEAGEWSIAVTYDDEHIQGSPFTCHVYDPHALKLVDIDLGPSARPGHPFTFIVDATGCGWGDAKVDVTQGGRSIPSKSLEIERGVYEITFTPLEAAKHKIYAYFSGHEVKGSPFPLYLGVEKPPDRKDSKSKKKKSSSRENKDPKDMKEIVKEYSSSALAVNSPRLSLSSLDTSHNRSTLSKVYDSTVNESYDSSLSKTYKSTIDKSYDTVDSSSYEPVLIPSNRMHDSSVMKSSSTYENINNKYADFESSSIVNRSSVLESSTKKTSTYESVSPKPLYSSSPKKISTYESSPSSPSKLELKNSTLDSSHNSSFNSTFNTSTSTVINTGITSKSSSIFNKSSSPGRLSSPSPRKSASPSPPPPSRVIRATSPIESRTSPIRATSPPGDLTGLSSPSKVLQIAQNAAKSSEDENSDPGGPPDDHINSRLSSEQRSPLLQSDERFTSTASFNKSSNMASSSTSTMSTTIRRMEDNLQTSGASRHVTSRIVNPVSNISVESPEEKRGGVRSGIVKTEYSIHGSKSDLRSDHGLTSSEEHHHYNTKDHSQKLESTTSSRHVTSRIVNPVSNISVESPEEKRGGVRSGIVKTEYSIHGSKSDLRSDHGLTSSEEHHHYNTKDYSQKLESTTSSRHVTSRIVNPVSNISVESPEEKRGGVRSGIVKTEYSIHGSKSDLRSDHGLTSSEEHHHYNTKDHSQKLESTTYLSSSTTSVDVTDAVSHRLQGASHHQHSHHLPRHSPQPQIDASRVSVSGPGVRLVSVSSQAEFTVSMPPPLRQEEVNVRITGPGKRLVPVETQGTSEGDVMAAFTPLQVGEYIVDVRVGDSRVPGSPFRCYVYNAQEIQVGAIPNGIVGRPVEFEIDGSSAGSGNLEILVNGGHVTSYVRNLGQQRFLASFVPHSAIRHTVEMRFNGEKVPGSPWSVEVMEGSGARVAVLGDTIKHFPAGQLSAFDISAASVSKEDIQVHIVSPAKRPVSYQLTESGEDVYRVAFITTEVGSYIVDVAVSGQKVQGSPFIAKAYDAGLIRVSDVPNGVVGQPCQFRVDASQAGEGQLEISINDGEVPNHVQVLGGGRCLVSFTPDTAKLHTIDIKFNGETVRGCPFVCKVADTSRVSLTLRHLELIPVGQAAAFNIAVDGGGSAELTVTVRTPSHTTLPVRVSGSVRAGFTAEFTPVEVGAHTIIVNYNDSAVSGTPFTCKVYDASKVGVSHLPRGAIGKSLQFVVDASEGGEGNLEISISAAGRNIPTQVHPHGSARFAVSFVPLEAIDHIINISFNKEPVQGSPFVAKVQADPNRIVVSGQSLAATAVGKTSFFTISNVTGSVEDVEVSVEGPNGLPVPAQVRDNGDHTFKVEFAPKSAGEHRIHVAYSSEAIPGSPFSCKVYDVSAIKVRPVDRGMVAKPVTFLVETNNAGPGNLEVTVNNGQVPTSAQAQGNHVYAISFTPKEAKPHVVELKFNGENVPGSPFSCEVVDVSRVTVAGAGLEKVPVDRPATFTVDSQATMDQLEVKILSPSRHPLEPRVSTTDEGKLMVEYTPVEVGDHSVEVRVAGMLVPGSPFLVKAYDANKVRVTEVATGIVAKPVYFSIDASQAGAGNLEIIVSVNGRNVPNYVQSEGHARFRVNFKPKEAAVHTLSVKFNGEPVPGSPFRCRVSDSSQVVISGAGIKMSSLARPAVITVDPRSADVTDCIIQVTSPAGARVPVTVSGELPNKLGAEFQPTEVGPHTINVIMDGESVGGSPFTCNIYDVTKVQVTGLNHTKQVNRPVTFTVDASQAGEGTLELVVTTAKASVRAEVAARSRGLYDVTFTPHESIPHFVNITFNEEEVLGSPFKCDVRELEPREVRNLQRKESQMVTAKGDGLKQVVTGTTASFTVDTKGLDGELDIRVTGPDGGQIPARLVKLRSGLHRAEYRADQVGSYSVAVLHQGAPISGTPYTVEAADPRRVKLQLSGECFSGQECALKVDASGAGRGSLSVGVRAAGQDVKHSIRDLGGGLYQVLFYPRAPIPHKVDVRYSGVPVQGGPFEVPVRNPATGHAVTATGLGLHQARVNKSTSFVIETLNQPSKDFDVLITGPQDWAVTVKCYQQKDGNLLAEYTPHTPGNYKIEVLCSNSHVKGSPFQCTAYDASRVVLDSNKTVTAVGEPCMFQLNTSEAGAADLEVNVEAPSGVMTPLEVKTGPSGEFVEWIPDAPGQYRIIIFYGGEEVPGSPVTVDVGESGLATVKGSGLEGGAIDTPLTFNIDGRGLLGEPHVTVDGPDSVARVNVRKQDEGLYQVTYVPHEVGIFDVRVQWNKRDVAGSPFHPKIVDPARVRLIGGWSSLQDSEGRLELTPREEKRLAFDVSEAGPGKLKAEVSHEGRPIEVGLDQTGSRSRLIFTPPGEGAYELHLWYSNLPLPNMPVHGWAEPVVTGDHTRVTLKGHGITTARCGEQSEFIIDGSAAGPGAPDVTMSGTKADVSVSLTQQGGGIWHAVYTPMLPGAYLLNVMWSDRQVRGCPLKVNVESVADASRVICSGEGLRHGMVGHEIKSFIDTRRAGPGELTVTCTGPQKVALCDLDDHGDGTFTLNIRPQESGRHALNIKYEGDHVPGSPYTLKVAGAPDPSKVRVYGPGIEHGVLASYQSRFICDTRGAGAGQLTVRIRGPKGAFRVEMQRESQKDRTILCKYDPTEPGDYRMEVKWSGEHVPGSPFVVMIFDTQDELNRYMAGGYSPTGPGGAPSEYYGSIGYGTTYGAVSFGQMSWRGSQAQL